MGGAKVYATDDEAPEPNLSSPLTTPMKPRPSNLQLEDEAEKKTLTPQEYVEVRRSRLLALNLPLLWPVGLGGVLSRGLRDIFAVLP